MSIYSFTRIYELPGNYINTRLRNICEQRGMKTVNDIWQHYKGHRYYGSSSGIGKKSAQLMQRIINKVKEVMDVMPLPMEIKTAAHYPYTWLPQLYAGLDEAGKEMADNVYYRLAIRMRSHARNWLEDACGDLTLSSLIETLREKNNPFADKGRTNPGSRAEVGTMLYGLTLFFQGEEWQKYLANPRLTLLRQGVVRLSGCLSSRMDALLVANRERIGTAAFPLKSFISTYLDTTTAIPYSTRCRLANLCSACYTLQPNAGKLWDEMREQNVAPLVLPAVALLERYGCTVPAHYRLPDAPYHTGDVKGQAICRGFEDVFLLLVYNPGYRLVNYSNDHGRNLMLVKDELVRHFDFAGLLREVCMMKNETIREAYRQDLFTLMMPFFNEESPLEEEDRLMDVAAAMIRDVYDLTTDKDKQLELKRNSKLQTHEYIEEILGQKGTPCTVDEVERELGKLGVVVTRETLRRNLNDKLRFVRVDEDNYALRGWKGEYRPTTKQTGSVVMMVIE